MAVLTDNMSAFWTLDNVLTDSSGHAYTLTNNAGVTFGAGKVYTNAATFVALSNQSLSRVDNTDFDLSAGGTITLWVKLASKADFMGIVSQDDYGTTERSFNVYYSQITGRFGAQGFASAGAGGGVSVTADSLGDPDTNTWYFIAVTFDNEKEVFSIRVNNDELHYTTLTNLYNGTAPLRIGSLSNNGVGAAAQAFDGQVEGVGIWNRALTADEVTLIYREGDGLPNTEWQSFPALQTAGQIEGICHRGGYSPHDTHSYEMFSLLCTDGTGINFEHYPSRCVNELAHKFRDPDRIYHEPTGKWWAACINELDSGGVPGNGVSSSFGLYSSTDGKIFTFVTNVDCSAITGAGAGRRCWKPRFLIDPSAPQTLRVYVGLASTGQPYLYEIHPTNAAFTTWSTPVIISGTALPTTIYDGHMQLIAGTYYLTYVNWSDYNNPTPLYIEVMSSTNPVTGFTVIKSGDWGLGSTSQGPCPLQRPDGKWLMYIDGLGGAGASYSLSSIPGTYPVVLASASWSAPALINIHGFANGQPHFAIEGPTFRSVPFDRRSGGGGSGQRIFTGLALTIEG